MSDSNMKVSNMVNAFKEAAANESATEKTEEGLLRGRKYLKIDGGEVSVVNNKSERSTFSEITTFIKSVIQRQDLSIDSKKKILNVFTLLTNKFEHKSQELNWWGKLVLFITRSTPQE